MRKVAFGESPHFVSIVAAVALLSAAGAVPAQAAQAGRAVTVKAGHLAPSGVAELAGKLPKAVKFRPKSYALSHTGRFSAASTLLDTTAQKAAKGRFLAWVGLRDDASIGHFTLLGCKVARPSRSGCSAPRHRHSRRGAKDPRCHSNARHGSCRGGHVRHPGRHPDRDRRRRDDLHAQLPRARHVRRDCHHDPGHRVEPRGRGRPTRRRRGDLAVDRGAGGDDARDQASLHSGAHAHAVAFGDVDPSGGAFPLPATASADTTIAVSEFGGTGSPYRRPALPCDGRDGGPPTRAGPL